MLKCISCNNLLFVNGLYQCWNLGKVLTDEEAKTRKICDKYVSKLEAIENKLKELHSRLEEAATICVEGMDAIETLLPILEDMKK